MPAASKETRRSAVDRLLSFVVGVGVGGVGGAGVGDGGDCWWW